jgi:primosomal protein N' (replication factor Y)
LETLKNANKQKEVVLTYFQLNASDKKPITVKKTTNSNSAIVALIEKEIFEDYHIQEDRVNFTGKLGKRNYSSVKRKMLYWQKTALPIKKFVFCMV